MDDLWQRLKLHWQQQNVALGKTATEAEIAAFEAKHQLRVPSDFRSYLLNVNGMANKGESDDNLHFFWTLGEMTSMAEDGFNYIKPAQDAEQFWTFADHCIRVFDFAVRFTSEPHETTPVYFVDGPPRQITATFGEFIERYIAGDATIIYP